MFTEPSGNGVYDQSFPAETVHSGSTGGDNNNLAQTVLALEYIYTKDSKLANKGSNGKARTLKEAGKSRADLWQLAAIAAIEYRLPATSIYYRMFFDICFQ